MSEKDVVLQTQQPITKQSLVHDLKELGLNKGDIIIAHASMSKLGWVVGREVTIIDALLEVLGEEGTLIMPSQTGDNSDPSLWQNPPVPTEWIEIIKEHMPVYDPKRTPTRSMGKVVDQLLMHPLCIRSSHPQVSFCGVGKHAQDILSHHQLTPGLGIGSPLQKLYDMNAKILLLGVTYSNCTSLHLPQTLANNVTYHTNGSKILVDGQPQWVDYQEVNYDDEYFDHLGEDYEKHYHVNKYIIGNFECRLIDMHQLCDYALTWINNKDV